ncbi:carboxylesterase family protein [Hymenobacter sp. J193]|uniref:carboxylesterase family protein n=1 Tax=Hymenobacter sp. J193 TaxID=2898429 RepID=UPI0021513F78|nr:carboxylesterase family protein [Hymenobacter sp. J193]
MCSSKVWGLSGLLLLGSLWPGRSNAQTSTTNDLRQHRVRIASGLLEGEAGTAGIHVFKGVPFAAPPVGELRWRAPQPAASWTGVRPARIFGFKPMQLTVYGDMNSRAAGMAEDCLYLNVWTPARSSRERLPVLVYFYGGWVRGR